MATTVTHSAPAPVDDGRVGRVRRLLPPAALGASAAAGLAVVFLVDPDQPGHFPLCPFRAITGWDCPGCGATRGMHDLVHGDVAGALDHNILLALAVPIALLTWLGWVKRSWTGDQRRREVPRTVVYVGIALVAVFWVVRNLPGVPYLPSG